MNIQHCLLPIVEPFPFVRTTVDSMGPFYKYGLTLIRAWISNNMSSQVWDQITYPFLNLVLHRWSLGMDQ